MDVGMIRELPAPRMEDTGKAGQVGADEARILSQFFAGLGRCLKQTLVGQPWVCTAKGSEALRYGEGHEEMRPW